MEALFLYKDNDGNIQRATAGEPIQREYLQEQVDKTTVELRQWSDALAQYDRLATIQETATPAVSEDKPQNGLQVVEDDGDGHIKFNQPNTTQIPVRI